MELSSSELARSSLNLEAVRLTARFTRIAGAAPLPDCMCPGRDIVLGTCHVTRLPEHAHVLL